MRREPKPWEERGEIEVTLMLSLNEAAEIDAFIDDNELTNMRGNRLARASAIRLLVKRGIVASKLTTAQIEELPVR